MKSKHLTIPMLLLASSLCLTACKSKETVDPLESSPAVEESTEDRFSISDNLNTDLSVDVDRTRPTVKATLETFEDGAALVEFDTGDTAILPSYNGLVHTDNLPERESLILDGIVSKWNTQPTLTEGYLAEQITADNLPSLTDSERESLIADITQKYSHQDTAGTDSTSVDESVSEDEEWPEPPTVAVPDWDSMSAEEQEEYVESVQGGNVGHLDPVATFDESLFNLKLERN